MISSKLVQASEEADFAYARWYAQLPDERKNQLFLNGHRFVAEKIRYDVKQANPFATEAEVMLRYIELTQKTDYPEHVFDFIRKKLQARAEQEWKQRFRAMKTTFGWTYDDLARFMGAASGDAVKASISRQLPAFAKLAVCIFEQLQNTRSKQVGE